MITRTRPHGPLPTRCPAHKRQARSDAVKKWKVANPDRVAKYKSSSYARRLLEAPDAVRNYRAGADRSRRPEWQRTSVLGKYGLNETTYDELLRLQGGVCAICKKPPDSRRRLAVDHDHTCCAQSFTSCGQCVRGLLCAPCNTAVGLLNEDVERIATALAYLKNASNGAILTMLASTLGDDAIRVKTTPGRIASQRRSARERQCPRCKRRSAVAATLASDGEIIRKCRWSDCGWQENHFLYQEGTEFE